MSEPVLIAFKTSDATDGGSTETVPSLSWLTGDVIYLIGLTSSDSATMATPTVAGLTFSLIASIVSSGNGNCQLYHWRATAGSNGSGSITATVSGATTNGVLFAWQYRNVAGQNTPASISSATNPVIPFTRTKPRSHVIAGLADFSAFLDLDVDATPQPGNLLTAQNNSGQFTVFALQWGDQAGAPSRTPYGFTNFSTATAVFTGYAIEIFGPDDTAPAAVPIPRVDTIRAYEGDQDEFERTVVPGAWYDWELDPLKWFDEWIVSSGSGNLFSQSVAGTLSFVGALQKQTNKNIAGALSFSGALQKQTNKNLAGGLSFGGALQKQTNKILAGVLSFSGAMTAQVVRLQSLAGSLSFSGALQKQTNKNVAGGLSFAGSLQKQTNKVLAGVLSFTGTLTKSLILQKAVSGILSFAGALGTLFVAGGGGAVRWFHKRRSKRDLRY